MVYVAAFVFLSLFAPATTSLVVVSGVQYAAANFIPLPSNNTTNPFEPSGVLNTSLTGLEVLAGFVVPVAYLLVCLIYDVRSDLL